MAAQCLPCATEVLPAAHWDPAHRVDRIALDFDARHRRRFRYTAQAGTEFLLDLPRAVVLQQGDGLLLSDGRVVEVAAADEAVLNVTAATPAALMRLAWHIGNRHLPAQIAPHSIVIRYDHVIADMLRGLGARVDARQAPFTPEPGAYAPGGHGHAH
ncbi:MAG: urease accessory protein UreE [Abyssibacter sp.]|jgi:urease accessory protein|nr:urease accessory protein UreE [Abyssibacter sp.]MBB88048.1 urease accessory protein UreE [Xanthomonadales bacterium]MCK5858093.1 urease accessory protein UreE [Abyssibacter sp.]